MKMMTVLEIIGAIFLTNALVVCCEPAQGNGRDSVATSKAVYDEILRPPPPPPPLAGRPPERWNGNYAGQRHQRHNLAYGYGPQPPSAIPPPNFHLPTPFSKAPSYVSQPNYRYGTPQLPSYTSQPPSVFQKVSKWLFPPAQSGTALPQVYPTHAGIPFTPAKKDCNPCNLVPWIPVLRYHSQPTSTGFSNNPPPSASAFNTIPQPTYGPPRPNYQSNILPTNQLHITSPTGQDLPKLSAPTGFRNSYGEPITLSEPYIPSYSSTAPSAEVADSQEKLESNPVSTVSVQNPNDLTYVATNASSQQPSPKYKPNSKHQGRGIHALQPIPVPNMSYTPLPPIINARPFRPSRVIDNYNVNHGYPHIPPKHIETQDNAIQIIPSIQLAEFTSSVDYPISIVQSPILDVQRVPQNHTSEPNNDNRDATSQASESHTATDSENNGIQNGFIEESLKDNNPSANSFTSDGNNIYKEINNYYDPYLTPEFVETTTFPPNHRPNFADLRGILTSGADDIFRTDQNLQAIDSPLLYLKPNIPHKDFEGFSTVESTMHENENYNGYDDALSTSMIPPSPTAVDDWDTLKFTRFPEEITDAPYYEDINDSENAKKPKVVQIIIPYTSDSQPSPFQYSGSDFTQHNTWIPADETIENQGRKVPAYIETRDNLNNNYQAQVPFSTTLPAENGEVVTENYESLRVAAGMRANSDLYDVKEPPFDILALQHNIDGWTEQEYTKHHKMPKKLSTHSNIFHAKKIPDEFFTTPATTKYYPPTVNDVRSTFYDHEFASSIRHHKEQNLSNITVVANINNNVYESNLIVPSTEKSIMDKVEVSHKPFVYTAASSFRSHSPTTTPQPWGKIQTSISPLTKEKVYVVTAQPWRDYSVNSTKWFEAGTFESRRMNESDSSVASTNYNSLFKSPRFSVRPTPLPTSTAKLTSPTNDFKPSFSWFQINNLQEMAERAPAPAPAPATTNTAGVTTTTLSSHDEEISSTTVIVPESDKKPQRP